VSAQHARTERCLAIDLAELEAAFDDASDMLRYYLDLATGRVVAVTGEIRDELNAIYAALEHYDDNAFAAALQQRTHPDWMRAALNEAHQVEQGYGTRYIAVPQADSHASYRVMEDFIETVADQRFQAQLAYAIQGRGAFRRFKDALFTQPDERERWFAFKTARAHEQILAWLESAGITTILE
jgi:tryptophanase